MSGVSNHRWQSAAWALLAAALALLWQTAAVLYGFDGNQSGLYYTGTSFGIPPALANEKIYVVPGDGWDGQFYHIVSHDPLIRTDSWRRMDAPQIRYRRILLPGMAFLLGAGIPTLIHLNFRLLLLASVFLGTYWLSRIAVGEGRNAAWGLGFCFIPATIVAVDRISVDVALAALSTAFVLCLRDPKRDLRIYSILICAALVRETGLLLTFAWCSVLFFRREWQRMMYFFTALLPALAWYVYVKLNLPPIVYHSVVSIPFSGLIDRFVHPVRSKLPAPIAATLTVLDDLGLIGVIVALWLTFRFVRESGWIPETSVATAFALLAVFSWHSGDWMDVSDFGRIFSPMLLMLGLRTFQFKERIWITPLALMFPRLGMQLGAWVYRITIGI